VLLAYPTQQLLPRVVAAGSSSDESAALLVVAEVPRWNEVRLRAEVAAAELEAVIRKAAESHGVDVSKPFPFLLVGGFRMLEWHVADGTRVEPGMAPDVNAQHGTIAEGDGTIVGFYSTQHQGVFTMMGQNLHMHVITHDSSILGHVRSADLAAGSTLLLPR
jgi:acetolactate decarboxylase